MNSFVLLAYASLAPSRALLQWLLVCLNQKIYPFRANEKVISMNCDSSKSSWKPWRWVRLDLILSLSDIYPSCSKITKFKDIPWWNISQMIKKSVPISTRIVRSYAVMESQWKLRQQHDQNFAMEGKSLQNNTGIQKEINPNSRTVRIAVWDLSRKVNHLSKVIWDYNQVYPFHQNR